jgi:hypothetical protein
MDMDSSPPAPPASADSLPPEALALATRLFDAARNGENEILEQALRVGLRPNMTNGKGDSLVCITLSPHKEGGGSFDNCT